MVGNKGVNFLGFRVGSMLFAVCVAALFLVYPPSQFFAAVDALSVPTVSIINYAFEDGVLNVEVNVLSDGGSTVSLRGVAWSKEESPTIENSHTNGGSGIGTFTSKLSDLEDGTTYYIRAFATNSDGTAYSGQLILTQGLPTISTVPVHGITGTSAWSGGAITSSGGTTIKSRGVCWGTMEEPNLDDNDYTDEGKGTGEFSSKMTELEAGTTYYVRAYAKSDSGVSYGEAYSFVPNNEVSSYMLWHNQETGKVIWWKLNNEGNLINNEQDSGWGYVSEDVTLTSNWKLSGTTVINDQDTLIWHNQSSGKVAYWKLTDEKKLKNSEKGGGWDFVANLTLTSAWRLNDVREIDGEKVLFWYNENNGKAAWWKLTDEVVIKNETKGEGWDYAADNDDFLGSAWNLAGVIDN